MSSAHSNPLRDSGKPRYAQIAKKALKQYRIVQDTHFSLGGTTAQTGKAGEADPVETHVYLDTGESDDFARTALDMAEQTCFLDALCRTDLRVKVALQAFSSALPDAAVVAPTVTARAQL